MERVISQEERIKRAEELYYRRKKNISDNRTTTVNVNPKKDYKLLKKIIIQILVCIGIYFAIYNLQGNNDNFSIDSINYVKNAIAYDVNIEEIFNGAKKYLNGLYIKDNDNKVQENKVVEETLSASDPEQQTNVIEETNVQPEEASSTSLMEQDAEYIKANFSLVKPVSGTITSRFGIRNPTTETVPKYHTGIDIAVNEGTVYVAAMDGTVEEVSSVGDYRKSCKNNE